VNVTVNGDRVEVPPDSTLADVMRMHMRTARGSAAAVNGVVVPRSEWSTGVLSPNAIVEIVTAVQGG
jgi:sulfur carrier protein